MAVKKFNPITPGQRHKVANSFAEITTGESQKSLIKSIKKQEVKEMERLEMELINKLNNTVALQKQAYEDLEKARNFLQ